MLAATAGATVYAVEPQPACIQIMHTLRRINHVHSQVHLCHNAVWDGFYSAPVDSLSCNPAFTVPRQKDGRIHSLSSVHAFPLDQLLLQLPHVDCIKVSAFGHEIRVLRSMSRTLQAQHVGSLLLTIVPFLWPRTRVTMQEGVGVLQQLLTQDQ
eukprot:NODE_659_length_1535_cov_76.915882_g540_i0.p3 GENE.NODE_659_length_1535_cov_76.915882_g540_i0~~NODE_659_length_1535_cov_76.915882_g540_i0.p3  ORF type:complete len:154 (+),score=27.34 NODE_659_length_1535_cov_76.915882_g540_i0:723-1184(+)